MKFVRYLEIKSFDFIRRGSEYPIYIPKSKKRLMNGKKRGHDFFSARSEGQRL